MPTLEEHITCYSATYDSFSLKCMNQPKAEMWRSKLLILDDSAVDKAFDELFSTQKYAFQLVDILQCVKKHAHGKDVIKIDTSHLPPVSHQNVKDLNQMIKLEAKYRSGMVTWDEFKAVAYPFCDNIMAEDTKVGNAVMARFEYLKGMKIVKPEKPIPVFTLPEPVQELTTAEERGIQFDGVGDYIKLPEPVIDVEGSVVKPEPKAIEPQEPQGDDQELEW